MSTQPILSAGDFPEVFPTDASTTGTVQPLRASSATAFAVAEAVRSGLLSSPKTLPPWLFYDEKGSDLFERITLLPEYYLTRTERALFAGYAEGILDEAGRLAAAALPGRPLDSLRVVELGAGTATKTGILLAAAVRKYENIEYLPVDVSPTAMQMACDALIRTNPELTVRPFVSNYVSDPLRLPKFNGPTLALYIGSSIGNFLPGEALHILQNLRSQLQPGDSLLLGTDLVKNEALLLAAYNDAAGVTEAFNLNILRRCNRELGANFDLSGFRHRAVWNPEHSRMEMHLLSLRAQTVRIPAHGMTIQFRAGESIHTENSYKFTEASLSSLLGRAGFAPAQMWMDEHRWFAVTLAAAV